MHMADALLSPAVGATMWTATAATTAYCAHKVREDNDSARIPLMGVAGAFIFASQMLNFTIPGTGSSGHIGGGLILAILLGPEAAFIVMASVLGVQALFFGDGGLLALGANVFNLGFFPAFIAYLLVYRPVAGDSEKRWRVVAASALAAVVGLQLGAFAVVLQTALSGRSALPIVAFAAVMQPIHLAIGVVEGFVTAGVVAFVLRTQPELLRGTGDAGAVGRPGPSRVIVGLAVAALLAGGALSWFASSDPDGLEWAIARLNGTAGLESTGTVHAVLGEVQSRTTILPDYAPRSARMAPQTGRPDDAAAKRAGTSTAGIVGAGVVLLMAIGAGLLLRRRAS